MLIALWKELGKVVADFVGGDIAPLAEACPRLIALRLYMEAELWVGVGCEKVTVHAGRPGVGAYRHGA